MSWYYYKIKSKSSRPSFNAFNADKRKAYVDFFNLYSIDDNPCLDFVGSYEKLDKDFEKVLKSIGLTGKVALPHVNESDGREERGYREFFDDVSRDMVQQWYAREITEFDYKF